MSVEDGTETETTADLRNDTLYDALSQTRRRYALHYLKQRDEPVSLQRLAEQIAAWENTKPVSELTSQERKRVYIALYQSHIETMAEEGLIKYDEETGMVNLSDSMKEVDLYLEVVPSDDVPWSVYYLGLVLASTAVLGLAWFNVQPFARVPGLAWGAIILIAFGASAVVQLYYTRQMRIGDEGPPPDINISE